MSETLPEITPCAKRRHRSAASLDDRLDEFEGEGITSLSAGFR